MRNYIKKRDKYRLTNYTKRYKLISGGKPYLAIRKSNKNLYVQVIEYAPGGDRIIWTASTLKMDIKNKKNCAAAKLLGSYCRKHIPKKDLLLYVGQRRAFPKFIRTFVKEINSEKKIVIAGEI